MAGETPTKYKEIETFEELQVAVEKARKEHESRFREREGGGLPPELRILTVLLASYLHHILTTHTKPSPPN